MVRRATMSGPRRCGTRPGSALPTEDDAAGFDGTTDDEDGGVGAGFRGRNEQGDRQGHSTTSSSSSAAGGAGGAQVLLLPWYVLSTTPPPGKPFRVAAISDGFDDGSATSCPDLNEYWRHLEAVGSEMLAELIRSEAAEGRPVRVLVYDPHLPWARRVAQAAGVPAAAFLSQPCAVDVEGEAEQEVLQVDAVRIYKL